MTLTNAEILNAKPKDKPYKLFGGGGLFLEVPPTGRKRWRLKYRFGGKEKLLSLGVYPEVPLAGRKDKNTGRWIDGARDKREAMRQLLVEGIDPGEERKAMKSAECELAANSFEIVAREWLAKFAPQWDPSSTARKLKLDLP